MTAEQRPQTLCEAFQATAAIDPEAIALRTMGGIETMTWREYATAVRQVAAGFARPRQEHHSGQIGRRPERIKSRQ